LIRYRLWTLLGALALVPSAASAKLFVDTIPASSKLKDALAAKRYDEAMTLARREHEACVEDKGADPCVGLLALQSDALTAWAGDHGDFDRDDKGEGVALRTARLLHAQVNKLKGFDGPIFASAFGNLGEMLTLYGRPVEGEQHLRDGLRYNIVRSMDFKGTERLSDPGLRMSLLRLTRNLALQGRGEEARGYLSAADSLLSTLALMGSPDAKRALPDYLAVAALVPGSAAGTGGAADFVEASVGYEWEREHDGEGWDPDEWTSARGRLARDEIAFLARSGETAKAVARFDSDPDLLRGGRGASRLEFLTRLGAALVAEGRASEGGPILADAISIVDATWDRTDDRRIDAHAAHGAAILALDPTQGAEAAAEYRQAVAGAVARIEATDTTEGLVRAIRRYRPAFEGLLTALPPEGANLAARGEAFEAAQWSSIGETAATLAKVSARTSRSAGPVAEPERFREQVRDSVASLNRDIAEWISVPGSPESDRDLLGKFYLRDVDAVMDEMSTEEIAAIDPAYDELVKPRPIAAERVQALLAKDEAVLFFLPDERGTSIFVLTQSGFTWHRSAMTRAALAKSVEQLRSQIKRDLRERWVGSVDNFDEKLAHSLYRELVAPVEASLGGATRLMTVTPGPLSSLPLTLLVTGGADSQKPEFLIDRYEISTLPSVSSLYSLRCLLRPAIDRPAVCGSGPGRSQPTSQTILFAAGDPALKGHPGDDRGIVQYSELFRRGIADPAQIMAMPSLPGTRREIEGVRSLFDPGRTITLLGAAATEGSVKTNPGLAGARYVLFSTHGLLASETGADGEPGLVFTPPAAGMQSDTDDGLLTASEAAQLRLAADIVVLSACNTASSNGSAEAEGLSGLAQSFFYAGARSLLVSHWPLDDEAGADVVTHLFSDIEKNPGSPSAAVRKAVLALRSNEETSSPAVWAPLAFVGATDLALGVRR
jgi:CHAT domain-containing protein